MEHFKNTLQNTTTDRMLRSVDFSLVVCLATANVGNFPSSSWRRHSLPVAVDLVDVALGEVPEHGAHVEVVLDRGAVEPHPQLFGQPLDLVAKRKRSKGKLTFSPPRSKIGRLLCPCPSSFC